MGLSLADIRIIEADRKRIDIEYPNLTLGKFRKIGNSLLECECEEILNLDLTCGKWQFIYDLSKETFYIPSYIDENPSDPSIVPENKVIIIGQLAWTQKGNKRNIVSHIEIYPKEGEGTVLPVEIAEQTITLLRNITAKADGAHGFEIYSIPHITEKMDEYDGWIALGNYAHYFHWKKIGNGTPFAVSNCKRKTESLWTLSRIEFLAPREMCTPCKRKMG